MKEKFIPPSACGRTILISGFFGENKEFMYFPQGKIGTMKGKDTRERKTG
jgi:hypothetical protein